MLGYECILLPYSPHLRAIFPSDHLFCQRRSLTDFPCITCQCLPRCVLILVARQDGAVELEGAALSFGGAVAVSTLCCCSTVSCVALCIKCITWMWGNRQRRPRIIRREIGRQETAVLGTNVIRDIDDATDQNIGTADSSGIELLETTTVPQKVLGIHHFNGVSRTEV